MIIEPAGYSCVFHKDQPVELRTLDNDMKILFCPECQKNLDSYASHQTKISEEV